MPLHTPSVYPAYPEEVLPEKERPGLQTVDVGDDKVKCVKITGDQLTKLANPENNEVAICEFKNPNIQKKLILVKNAQVL